MTVTTHVLDTARGRPAHGVRVELEARDDGAGAVWRLVGGGTTNADGRVPDLLGDQVLAAGVYRLTFDTGRWFADRGVTAFYPVVEITFEITGAGQHHHVPLLLSPFGYSTYRGS